MDAIVSIAERMKMGRRGLVLALFGIAWMLQGVAIVALHDLSSGGASGPFIHELIPYRAAAFLWVASGGLAVMNGFRRSRQDDTVGFVAVSGMPFFLAGSFGLGGIVALTQGSAFLAALGLLGFSVWGVVGMALALIASWPEPPANSLSMREVPDE